LKGTLESLPETTLISNTEAGPKIHRRALELERYTPDGGR
jgi:hypothetical protein